VEELTVSSRAWIYGSRKRHGVMGRLTKRRISEQAEVWCPYKRTPAYSRRPNGQKNSAAPWWHAPCQIGCVPGHPAVRHGLRTESRVMFSILLRTWVRPRPSACASHSQASEEYTFLTLWGMHGGSEGRKSRKWTRSWARGTLTDPGFTE